MSKRGDEWTEFALDVLDHVESYTVPQYGDKPSDLMTTLTAEQVEGHLMSYLARLGTSSRTDPRESLLDCLKIAHVACLLHSKRKEAQSAAN